MGVIDVIAAPFRALAGAMSKRNQQPAADGAQQPQSGPEPVRIAMLGHTKSGKTVFYSMLYSKLQNDPDLQMSATTATTAEYMHRVINLLKGLQDGEDQSGRRITRQVEPEFPNATIEGGTLQYALRMPDGGEITLEMKEYPGEDIALQSLERLGPEMRAFFQKADCIFFMIDPNMLDAEVELEARIGSLIILLQWLADGRSRAEIPLALVVTKADTLPGFHHEDQVTLIPASFTVTSKTRYEELRRAILASEVVRRESVWTESVTKVLDATSRLLRIALHHADGLQIFFVSSVGKPERRISEFGDAYFRPPRPLVSIGLAEPFRWWARISVARGRERGRRRFARVAMALFVVTLVLGAAWQVPHEFAWSAARARLRENRCEGAKRYVTSYASYVHPTFRAAVMNAYSIDSTTLACVPPCPDWARQQLNELNCRSDRLNTCEDVRALCIEPLNERRKAAMSSAEPAPAPPTAPGQPVPPRPAGDANRYLGCWSDLQIAMVERIQSSRAGDSLLQQLSSFSSSLASVNPDAADSLEAVFAVQSAAESLVTCAARSPENLERQLGPQGKLAYAVYEVLAPPAAAPGQPPAPGLLATCSPDRLSTGANTLSQKIAGLKTSGVNVADAEKLVQWLHAHAFACLSQSPQCATLGTAPKELAQQCVQACTNFSNAMPPPELRHRANQLAIAANKRIAQLELAAGGGGGPGAPMAPAGAPPAGAGAGPAAPPMLASPVAGAPSPPMIAQQSHAWSSVKVLSVEVTQGQKVYFKKNPADPWGKGCRSFQFANQRACVNRGETLYMAFSDGSKETAGAVDARTIEPETFERLIQKLVAAGQPAGEFLYQAPDGKGTLKLKLEGSAGECN